MNLARALTAEVVGTFVIVLFGPGSAVVQAQTGALGLVGVALANGLAVAAAVAALAPTSGAHLNPAATLALVLTRRFPARLALPYVGAQLVGAALAALSLLALFGLEGNIGATVPSGGAGQAFALEAVMTGLLILAALRSGLPHVVGGVVVLDILMGGPITGASMNPARSFGPALASGVWESHWLYWAAPLTGAALAVAVNAFIAPSPARALEPESQRAREFAQADA